MPDTSPTAADTIADLAERLRAYAQRTPNPVAAEQAARVAELLPQVIVEQVAGDGAEVAVCEGRGGDV